MKLQIDISYINPREPVSHFASDITIEKWEQLKPLCEAIIKYKKKSIWNFNTRGMDKIYKIYPEYKELIDEFVKYLPKTIGGITEISLVKYWTEEVIR